MLYPKKNPVARWIFKIYVKWLVNNEFHRFVYNHVEADPQRSVLLIGNHFSFWDGLILYCLNEKLLKKKFHVMILEDTAIRVGALRYGGAFSVDRNSRSLLESLDYAANLLNDPDNLVLMFPQGRLFSNFIDEVRFEKGVQRIMEKAKGKFQMLLAATFVEYMEQKKPSVTIYLKPDDEDYAGKSIEDLQKSYQEHYNSSKLQQIEIVI
jgi:1-acyl-sn-glycerol-3-phosphate acyltransferase